MLLRARLHRFVQRQLHSERDWGFLASQVLVQTGARANRHYRRRRGRREAIWWRPHSR
jgi:hypothetical protein